MGAELDVLIVEDNVDDERLTLRALKRTGVPMNTVVVRDGQQACDYLFAPDAKLPSFVLLDLKLPKVNGHEVLQQIRGTDRTKHLSVVVFSSSSEQGDVLRSYMLGANSYVQKPVEFEHFMDIGAHLGKYWLALNRPAVSDP